MYPIANAVKALFESEQNQVLRITGTDKNGTAISITDENVRLNGFNIDRFSCNGEKMEIGAAIASEMTLKLNNDEGQYDGIVFEGAELYVEIGIADWSQSSPTVTYIPCGYFTPDYQPRSLSTITIHALDRMMRFDAVLPTLTPWTDQNGNIITDNNGNIIYFVADLVFPCTIAQLVKQCAVRCNVPFTQSLSSLPNYNYTISQMPALEQQITFRDIIQWCAGIMGTNAWIDWNGSLQFSWYNTASYTSTTANRYNSDMYETDISITGVQHTNMQGATLVSGTADYALDMTGNYLMGSGVQEILTNIKNQINGFAYRPFSASVINAPYLWPMDRITFTDKDGNTHNSLLTNVNFGINGVTNLGSKGETEQSNNGAKPSGLTDELGYYIEKSAENMKQLDANLDQEGIFNRLTNNGEEQGLILFDGKLYMNASYIRTGTMVANFIKGGTLTLGGIDNVNGTLIVKDANGNTIGTWDKNGINVITGSITGGSINGATVTLGGSNNASGTLIIKDSGGNTIGTFNNAGITINKGEISGPSIMLGGSNNINGTITVKDSGGNTIGTWGYTGLNLDKGTIHIQLQGGSNDDYIGINDEYVDYDGSIGVRPLYVTYNKNNKLYRTILEDGISTSWYGDTIADGYSRAKLNARSLNIDIASSSNNASIILDCWYYYSDPIWSKHRECRIKDNSITMYDSDGTQNTWFSLTKSGMTVAGTKSRVVSTDQYSDRLLYCYETPTPMFGDIGEGTIAEDGRCYVWLDPVFAQTVATDQYQVFLQRYGDGDCYVSERRGNCFIVIGTPGLQFGWEIKAKQRDYDQKRLDRDNDKFNVPNQTYGEDAAQYIQNIQKERISA